MEFPVYSEAALARMSFDELADQCVNACIRRDPDTARQIYHADIQAKLKLVAEKDRKEATIKAYHAQVRMRKVLADLYPELIPEEIERMAQERDAPAP